MFNISTAHQDFSKAIMNGNLSEVVFFVSNFESIPFFIGNSQDFVDLAYSYKQFGAVEAQISGGALFNIKSLFQVNDFSYSNVQRLKDNILVI